jgi:uncharacterized Zn finger protein (UPF0148 family)
MKDYHCPSCGRFLFKSDAAAGAIQTICKSCRTVRIVYLDRKVARKSVEGR